MPSTTGPNASVPGVSVGMRENSSSDAASNSSVLAVSRRSTGSSAPPRISRNNCATCAALSWLYTDVAGELSAIARWNSPRADGIVNKVVTAPPPADSPNTVTQSGSPPKAAMFACTQRRAAIMSCIATLVSNR